MNGVRKAAVLVGFLSAVSFVQVSADSDIAGYTAYAGAVGERSQIDLDVVDMKELVASGNYTEALKIYDEGKYSAKTADDGTESFRTLAGFGTKALKGKVYESYSAYWNDPNYADSFTRAACQGDDGGEFGDFSTNAMEDSDARAQCCIKGAQYHNTFQYVIHELDDAIEDCRTGQIDANGEGALAWDEGWAFYAGSLEDGSGGNGPETGALTYNAAENRCEEFATCIGEGSVRGNALVNVRLLELWKEGQDSLIELDCDEADRIKGEIINHLYIPLIQGMLKYMSAVETTAAPTSKDRGELWAFASAVAPYMNYLGNSELATSIIENANINSTPMQESSAREMNARVQSVYNTMGVRCDFVGGLRDGEQYVDGMGPCETDLPGGHKMPAWAVALLVIFLILLVAALAGFIWTCTKGKKDRKEFLEYQMKQQSFRDGAVDVNGESKVNDLQQI